MEFSTQFTRHYLSHGWRARHWLESLNPRIYGSGRAALIDIVTLLVRQEGISTLLVPDYQCREVYESLGKIQSLRLEFYPITQELLPDEKAFAAHLPADSTKAAVLLVDYFASTPSIELEKFARSISGRVIFDLVHSWPTSAVTLDDLDPMWIVVMGYRKLFWKIFGAVVIGKYAQQLALTPKFIPFVAPNFPKNFSLRPRWGFLGTLLLQLLDLNFHEKLALKWRPRLGGKGGLLAHFNSPVALVAASIQQSGVLGNWPDLWEGLSEKDRKNANQIKSSHVLCKKL